MNDKPEEDAFHRGIRRIAHFPDGRRVLLPSRSLSDAAHRDAYGRLHADDPRDGIALATRDAFVRGPYGEAVPLNITPDPNAAIEADDATDTDGNDHPNERAAHKSADTESADGDAVRDDPAHSA